MGSDYEFGPDTDAIRRWLSQRDTYRADAGRHRGDAPPAGPVQAAPSRAAEAPVIAPSAPARPATAPDGRDVGRSILETLGDVTPAADAPPVEAATGVEARLDALVTPPPAVPEPAAAAETAADEPKPPTKAAEPAPSGLPTDLLFTERATARRITGFVLLLALVGTAVAGYLAYQEPSTATYGIAATLGVLTLALWAIRASTTSTHVQVRRGVLEVRRGGGLEVADLANPYTPIAILGTPERRNWRVLIERVDRPLLEIDASMVDPIRFTGLLLRLRPELWDAPVDENVF